MKFKGDPAEVSHIFRGIRNGKRIGATGGGLLGGTLGALKKKDDEGKKISTKGRVLHGALGALYGGLSGRALGGPIGGLRALNQWKKGFRPAGWTPSSKTYHYDGYNFHESPPINPRTRESVSAREQARRNAATVSQPSIPDWLKNAKNKREARSAYFQQAKKFHPDTAGKDGEDAIRNLNKEWETHEPYFKTAMLKAFADELEKMAGLGGAIAGGVVGYNLPGGMKNKTINTLMGAGLGHAAGELGGIAKRKIIDEPHQRELQELYGYQPSVQGPAQGSNYY